MNILKTDIVQCMVVLRQEIYLAALNCCWLADSEAATGNRLLPESVYLSDKGNSTHTFTCAWTTTS